MARYSKISADLRAELSRIPAVGDFGLEYPPCDVRLKDGRRVSRVYVVPEDPYIKIWGVWPEDDKGKLSVLIDDVVEIRESADRLPASMAAKLYAAGESGMGYCVFTVLFNDGACLPFASGGAVDFIEYPPGKGPANVVDVIPHEGRDEPDLRRAPEFHWCLYSEET
jgi:hypothetical protein